MGPGTKLTFTAKRVRLFAIVALVLVVCAVVLIAIGHADDDRGLLYFLGYPFLLIGLAGVLFFALHKPAQLIIAADHIVFKGRRFELHDIAVGEKQSGELEGVAFSYFALTTTREDGKMIDMEISSLAWADFNVIYDLLRSSTRPRS
jgi:hypothetical protein